MHSTSKKMPPYTLVKLETVDSTNNWAKRNLSSCSPDHPTFIFAREQTSGRGRGTNHWLSPKDQNLYLTIVDRIRPPLTPTLYSQSTSLAAIALLQLFGIQTKIRWPNDLFVGSKKIGGILAEGTHLENDQWAIVGIGINVNMEAALLQTIDQPATSMYQQLSHALSLKEVKQRAVQTISSYIAQTADTANMNAQYHNALSWMNGCEAVLQTPQSIVKGTISGFSPEGHIILCIDLIEERVIAQAVLLSLNPPTAI